ncbi:hypothetical protein [Prevotellamassilia timonensis]|uniref:hypothetical protein n=1 Tax=Prevotellamassilia timonensis TaxID=1852370 RepID=UPI003A91BCB6
MPIPIKESTFPAFHTKQTTKDAFIYQELPLPISERHLPTEAMMHDEADAPFNAWRQNGDKVAY